MHKLNVILSLACLALSSCLIDDFTKFEDEEVWVRSNGPGSIEGGFGFAIIPAGSTTEDLKYFVAANLDPVFLPVKFDQAGGRSAQEDAIFIRGIEDGNAELGTQAVIATDEGSYASANGNVAIGYVDAANAAKVFMLIGEGPAGAAAAGRFLLSAGSGAPSGVAFGNSNSGAGQGVVDLYAVAGNQLNILSDYQALDKGTPAQSCSLPDTGGGLLLADVEGTNDGDEIIVAVAGEVFATTGLKVETAAAVPEACFDNQPPLGSSITAPGGEASFGQLMDQGDFDGNGAIDLVIAAPDEGRVYVAMNWDTASAPTMIEVQAPGGAKGFGKSIAVGDFNADGSDELVVGAPQSDIAAHPEAGKVFIFGSDGSGVLAAAPLTLHDARADDKQVFGSSVAVAKAFGEDVLIVGANDEVFTYYRTPVTGDDDFRQ